MTAWHPRQLGPQYGRTAVVTGANSGIGFEVAQGLVRRGAHVVLGVRDTGRGQAAAARLHGPGSTSVIELDLADLDQIPSFVATVLERHERLSVLVANAGIMGGPLQFSPQGHERQMAVNHLGHVALIAALWPLLQASGSRLVMVSSSEARHGQLTPATTHPDLFYPTAYDGRQTYRNTKQANLLFAQELHRRCRAARSPVSTVAVHPGAAATGLLARQLERGGHDRMASISRRATAALLPSAAAGARSTFRALCQDTPSGAFVGSDRFGQLHGPPQLLEIYESGRNPATAACLWERTEQALGTPLPL